ncbi:MAG: Alpha/beta hydrolase fold protein [Labilithrix sp.]|nr:Alpha/beta hydrolase fold protein [Labilithrix sp.]
MNELRTSREHGLFIRERSARTEGSESRRVLLVHGNIASGVFFEPLMKAAPENFHLVAPDLRGYGDTDPRPIDGTRGLRDFSDDLSALCASLGWTHDVHLVGWSVGGGVVMQLALDQPSLAASITLVAPVPPRGFGGNHGVDGTPNAPDFAGSGGGVVSPGFVEAIRTKDRGEGLQSPRTILRKYFFDEAHFTPPPELEEAWVDAILATRIGDDYYPGDSVPSTSWPLVAPGTRGVANAFSAKYLDLTPFATMPTKPPVLWIRGVNDGIVSDASFFDLALLGKLGLVPGYPGEDAVPPQPMVAQTRALLDRYREGGGEAREVALPDVGHSPFLEAPALFLDALVSFITQRR